MTHARILTDMGADNHRCGRRRRSSPKPCPNPVASVDPLRWRHRRVVCWVGSSPTHLHTQGALPSLLERYPSDSSFGPSYVCSAFDIPTPRFCGWYISYRCFIHIGRISLVGMHNVVLQLWHVSPLSRALFRYLDVCFRFPVNEHRILWNLFLACSLSCLFCETCLAISKCIHFYSSLDPIQSGAAALLYVFVDNIFSITCLSILHVTSICYFRLLANFHEANIPHDTCTGN